MLKNTSFYKNKNINYSRRTCFQNIVVLSAEFSLAALDFIRFEARTSEIKKNFPEIKKKSLAGTKK